MSIIIFEQINVFKINSEPIFIPGYKHLIVQILASTILFPEVKFKFHNVPNILDTEIILKIFTYLGANVNWNRKNLVLDTRNIKNKTLPIELTKQVHGALYLLPVILGRFHSAIISETGGCALIEKNQLGNRPFLHIKSVLECFGANVTILNGSFYANCDELKSKFINIFDYSSCKKNLTGPYVSGACKTAILCALALSPQSIFQIENPYLKPDVVELVKFINLLGLQTEINEKSIFLKTINRSHLPKSLSFTFMEDISTLMTYICIAVMFQQDLKVNLRDPVAVENGLKEELILLKKMGLNPTFSNNIFYLKPSCEILALEIDVYSTGIYSDHQPFFALMLTKAKAKSIIREHVWKTRFSYANELKKIGFHFEVNESELTILPSCPKNIPATLHAYDLRAAAVLSIGACLNKAQTKVTGLEHLNRGYEDLLSFLSTCGVNWQKLT